MEARARSLADQDNSTFPTSAQYLEYLSDRGEELWDRMLAAGLKPAVTTTSVTATGAASYTLGTTPISVLSVERNDGQERIPLHRAEDWELPALRSIGSGNGFADFYEITGGATGALSLELYPLPSTGTYTVRYVPRFTRFTAGSDVFFGPPRSDRFMVVGAAIDALGKEGDTASDLRKELAIVFEDIIRYAQIQDAQHTSRVRDVYVNRRRYYPFDDLRVRREDW
jgi:hypothetical protein